MTANQVASREIVPVLRPRTLLSRCEIRTRAATANDVQDLCHAGRKRGQIRPVGTISREGMRAHISRQGVTLLYKLYLITLSLAMIPRKEVLTYGNLAMDPSFTDPYSDTDR